MVNYLEAWFLAKEINYGEVYQEVASELRVVFKRAEDGERILALNDDGLVPMLGVAFRDFAGESSFDLGDKSGFSHLQN